MEVVRPYVEDDDGEEGCMWMSCSFFRSAVVKRYGDMAAKEGQVTTGLLERLKLIEEMRNDGSAQGRGANMQRERESGTERR